MNCLPRSAISIISQGTGSKRNVTMALEGTVMDH